MASNSIEARERVGSVVVVVSVNEGCNSVVVRFYKVLSGKII